MSDILLIGSCEPFSGKSAMVLGIAKKLLQNKKKVRIGKPLATCIELTNLPSMSYEGLIDDDVKFIGSTLNIEEENLISSVGSVSYTHLTLPTILACRSRWSPYH